MIRLESRTGGGRQEGVIVLPVNDPVTKMTRSVSGSGDCLTEVEGIKEVDKPGGVGVSGYVVVNHRQ